MKSSTNFLNCKKKADNPNISSYQVTAVYAGSALSFYLPNGDTFADLADLLDNLGERHCGAPTAIYLKLGSAGRPICIFQPGASS